MSDEQPIRPLTEGEAPAPNPSSLKGLTMALGIGPAESGQDSLLGRDIGGVRIIRLIAEGGMGRVYEGKQEKPNRTVAVKVMRPGLTSPSVLKRFEYEAEVLGRLQHPGIAHIYSVGVYRMGNASVPYFVMEYIADARTLTKYATDLKLPTRQRLDLFRSVCDAVAHGHHKGVIHRDLKPSNILVDATGQPKVIDFGVARATDSDMALTTMQTDVGQLIGTLQYMSPEQFKADPNDIDVRSDVYALGVILYELLAGKMPYDVKKKAIHEVARIVQEDDPTPLSSFNRALRGDVAVIAGKCLEKDRGRRYSSASELGADIERFLTGDPISASPPGFVDGILRLAKKHRAAAAAVVGVFAALVLAVVGISVFASRANEARRLADSERMKAEEARKTAEERRQQAEAAEAKATHEKEVATRRLYEANVYRLEQLIENNKYDFANPLYHETAALVAGKAIPIELRCLRARCEQAIAVFEGLASKHSCLVFSPDGTTLATGSEDGTARLWDTVTGQPLVTFEGHGDVVWAVALSPDRSRLATASKDGTARLWDAANGKQLAMLTGHDEAIISLAFSPTGTCLATGSLDKTVRLWDAATGGPLGLLTGHGKAIVTVVFSPDGTRLATGSFDQTVRVWDAEAKKQLFEFKAYVIRPNLGLAFSPDGTKLLVGGAEIVLWNVETGQRFSTLKGAGSGSVHARYSPDGKRIVTTASDKTALWDAATGRSIAELDSGGSQNEPSAFSRDGLMLANGASDRTVRLWDAVAGKQVRVLEGHEGRVFFLAFNPDGRRLTSASVDGTVRLWDIAASHGLTTLDGHLDAIWTLAFSPDGTKLVTGALDNTARIWDAVTGRQLAVLEGHGDKIRTVAFSPDGTRLATGSFDNTARLWDAKTGRHIAVLEGHGDTVGALAFSPDGTRLATGSWDKTARLWDAANGKQVAVFEGHGDKIATLAYSPDGEKLATGSWDGSARLWNVITGRELAVCEGHSTVIRAVVFSPDGTRIATASGDKTACLWNVANGKREAVLEGHDKAVWAVAFSPDGTRLATGSDDETARLWDSATGRRLTLLKGHGGPIRGLAFSPDGTRVATVSADERAFDFIAEVARDLKRLNPNPKGIDQAIFTLAFSPDGKTLATNSSDRTVIWDAQSGSQLVTLQGHGAAIDTLTFSPQGGKVVTVAPGDKSARLWGVSNAEIYRARLETDAIERRLDERVTAWLQGGPEAAVARLQEAKATLTPDEYRVVGNMILSRSAAKSPAAGQR